MNKQVKKRNARLANLMFSWWKSLCDTLDFEFQHGNIGGVSFLGQTRILSTLRHRVISAQPCGAWIRDRIDVVTQVDGIGDLFIGADGGV